MRTVMHLIGSASFWYGIHYFATEVHFPISPTGYVEFGGKFKFLTFLNAVNITIFVVINSFTFISMQFVILRVFTPFLFMIL